MSVESNWAGRWQHPDDTGQRQLTADHYHSFAPEMERLIDKHGKIRVLFDMRQFHGWSLGALWEDIKFDLKHFKDIDRLAMVGDRTWENWMATFCRPFTSADIRYFDQSEAQEARQWINEELPIPRSYDRCEMFDITTAI